MSLGLSVCQVSLLLISCLHGAGNCAHRLTSYSSFIVELIRYTIFKLVFTLNYC